MLEPVNFDGFGAGLNLAAKADAVSPEEAIDLMNVELTERAAIKQRPGYDNLTPTALTNRVGSLEAFYTSAGTRQLMVGCGTRLEALNTSGGVVASATGATDGIWDFARFGAPGSELIYASQGNDRLRSWNGSAFTGPIANTPAAGALAVMAVDQGNRLVAGRFNTTTGHPVGADASTPSTVWFSDPGAPESYTVNNFVVLTPGDGEKVQAIVAWREFTFVFKESKFFVFHGTSEDAGGAPVFNYYTVDTGVGLVAPRAVAADETGVYFLDRTGVYRTTGGDPVHISRPVEPIFYGGASVFYTGGVLDHGDIANCAMTAHNDRIYLAYPTDSANDRVLVYDTLAEWWSLWDVPASCLATFRRAAQPELVFGYASGANHVGFQLESHTNDDGAAITSHWRSGWFDFGIPNVKVIRESLVWGSGKTFCGVSADFAQNPGELILLDMSDPSGVAWSGGSTWSGGATWGTPGGREHAFRSRSEQGSVFSTRFYNDQLDVTWAVARLAQHLRETRVPSALAT